MQYLISFYIKNESFPFQDYGLSDRHFILDVTKQLSQSKAVNTTDYPLLDTTTRIDAISLTPGTINFLGTIGELHITKNMERSVKDTIDQNRLQRSIELLERLRDNAYVLDVITPTKTFTNYIMRSLNINMTQFGTAEISVELKEFIAFGNEIKLSDYVPTSSTTTGDEPLILPSLALNPFINNDQLNEELYRIIKNSTLSLPYIITFSGPGQNSDVNIPSYQITQPTLTFKTTRFFGIDLISSSDYTSPRFLQDYTQRDIITGYVNDDIKLQVTFPQIRTNSSISNETTLSFLVSQDPVKNIVETPRYPIIFKLIQKNKTTSFDETGTDEVKYSVVNRDIFVTPRYSDIRNGINPTLQSRSKTDLNKDVIYYSGTAEPKQQYNFLKTCTDGIYRVSPNLLSIPENGYLYDASYIRIIGTGSSTRYLYQPSYVYIHPRVLPFLRLAIENVITSVPNHYLKGKTIIWW